MEKYAKRVAEILGEETTPYNYMNNLWLYNIGRYGYFMQKHGEPIYVTGDGQEFSCDYTPEEMSIFIRIYFNF